MRYNSPAIMNTIHDFSNANNPASRFGDLEVGWTVRITQKLKEGEKGKSQVFEGIIIAHKHGDEPGATITVRRVVGNYGVEKVYPLRLPSIEKIEVVKKGRTRRAKMYYLREKTAREIRRKTRTQAMQAEAIGTESEAPAAVAETPATE
jgi:large subunit ribosomal protein L19